MALRQRAGGWIERDPINPGPGGLAVGANEQGKSDRGGSRHERNGQNYANGGEYGNFHSAKSRSGRVQRTENRGRRTEDGGRRTEDRGQKTEDGRRKTEEGFLTQRPQRTQSSYPRLFD